MFEKKDRYYVNYCRLVNGVYSVIKKKRVQKEARTVSFRGKSYVLDYGKVIQRKGRNALFLVDIDASQVAVEGSKQDVSAELIDAIMEQETGRQFIARIQMGLGTGWGQLIMGILLGVAVGFIIGQFVKMPSGGA